MILSGRGGGWEGVCMPSFKTKTKTKKPLFYLDNIFNNLLIFNTVQKCMPSFSKKAEDMCPDLVKPPKKSGKNMYSIYMSRNPNIKGHIQLKQCILFSFNTYSENFKY